MEPHFFPDLRRMLWLNASHNEVPAMREMPAVCWSRSSPTDA